MEGYEVITSDDEKLGQVTSVERVQRSQS